MVLIEERKMWYGFYHASIKGLFFQYRHYIITYSSDFLYLINP